jgi:hypothetical protein
MGGPESVIHIDVAQFRELFRKPRVIRLLLGVIAQVLQKQHLARRRQHGFHFRTHAIRRESHGSAQKLLQLRGHRLHTHLRIRLAFGTAQVRCEDYARAVFQSVINRRDGSQYALVAGDFLPAVLLRGGGERNVEIHSDEDTLPFEVEIPDRQFRHLRSIITGRIRRRIQCCFEHPLFESPDSSR